MSVVRHAKISDSRSVNAISAALGYAAVSDAAVQQWLEALVASDVDQVWVCETNGEIVAWLHALRSVRLASAPFIEIAGLAVDSNRRREGIGRTLVNQAIAWAGSQGLKVRVRCNSDRAQSHQFYESIGFTRTKSQVVFEHYL